MRLGASAPNLTVCSLSSVGSEHLVYTERVAGSSPAGTTMKKLLIILTLLLSSCATRNDVINLGVAVTLFTTVTTMEKWAPENVQEQIEAKNKKNEEDFQNRIEIMNAKKDKMRIDSKNRKEDRQRKNRN